MAATMEELLLQMGKDCSAKFSSVKKACQDAVDLLKDVTFTTTAEAHKMRDLVLGPLQMAFECKNLKLASSALKGIQCMLSDERFHSSMESEVEEKWLPVQVLRTVSSAPSQPEEIQVEVMKLLLNMAFSTAWCMNAGVITKICELLLEMHFGTSKQSLRNTIINSFFRTLEVIFHHHGNTSLNQKIVLGNKLVSDTYGVSPWFSVKTAVKATLTQLLTAMVTKLREIDEKQRGESINSAIEEFTSNGVSGGSESLSKDVVTILKYLCDKLYATQHPSQNRQVEPLMLEGIYAVLSNLPSNVHKNQDFVDLIWQQLCPNLIAILGNPLTDKTVTSQKAGSATEDIGRGSGCSGTAPNVQSMSAKTIYSIAVELVRLVGCYQSLRPVLESVFHRMLLYPPPVHRHEALKAVRELLNSPERLLDLCGPTIPEPSAKPVPPTLGRKKASQSELSLLKLIIDSVQECCHCHESPVCITTVNLVNDLLTSVEQLVKGHGINMTQVKAILEESDLGAILRRQSSQPLPADSTNTLSVPEPDIDARSSSGYSDESESIATDTENDNVPSDDEEVDEGERDDTLGEEGLRKTLHSAEEKRDMYQRRQQSRCLEYEAAERRCAQDYVSRLAMFLPALLRSANATDVDTLLQKFSSDVCAAVAQSTDSDSAILNADGVYLTTYSAILLNLKLLRNGYYSSEEKSLCMAEQQFVDQILSTDLLVFLSRSWLAEVFQQIIQKDLLSAAGYKDSPLAYTEFAIVELLTDMDGLGSRKIGGQLLSSFRDLETVTDHKDIIGQPLEADDKLAVDAGSKFARSVLSITWEGILDVLSVLVSGKSDCGLTENIAIMFNAREESRKAQEAICMSLEGLQKAARLSCILGLQDRCGAVFAQLSNASCVVELEDIKRDREQRPAEKKPAIPTLSARPRLARLHAAHVLSMDVILSIGLEMGSHASDCWQHVFKCCAHISELEHTYFSQGLNQTALPKVTQETPHLERVSEDVDFDNPSLYSPMMAPAEPVAPTINVREIIRQSSIDAGWDKGVSAGGVLTAAQASKSLCGLAQEVDRLYEDAANKLNMAALVQFLSELCKASHRQLSTHGKYRSGDTPRTAPGSLPTTALHLYRLGDIVLKCLHSQRPLLHIMRTWSVVAPHFVEAACHKDRSISKKAVHCIHEVTTSLLGSQPELPHFHFNESLCKPFENLLCLELCDGDVQDQIVCSICELVEACTNDIKSGWRPLFGALRAVKIEYTTSEEVNEARQRHIAAVLDVFEVFLNTDNVLVFANAAVDCIMCLLKYVRGPGEFEDHEDEDSDSGSDMPASSSSPTSSDNLILPALAYLHKCCDILASMWKMPACPVFNGAHRIKADSLRCVDPVIPNMNLEAFQKPFLEKSTSAATSSSTTTTSTTPAKDQPNTPSSSLTTSPTSSPDANNTSSDNAESPKAEDKSADSKSLHSIDSGIGAASTHTDPASSPQKEEKRAKRVSLSQPMYSEREGCELSYVVQDFEEIDNHTGVLHVYYLVLEGLASTVSSCPKNYQPQTLEKLFELIRSSSKVPGPNFALHCLNHLMLPMLQSWLRRGNQLTGYWDATMVTNFKQCAGLCTDLVVEFIIKFSNSPDQQSRVEYLLKQSLDVLTECVAQPIEALSRLGCACIRHSLLSCGPMLTEPLWYTAACCLRHAFHASLYSLRQLMTPFQANSENFYGDIGQVKVAVRKDCSGIECERLRLLAQQVFLLDNQRSSGSVVDYEMEEDRSYIFLIYPPGSDEIGTRVPFRSVVVGLLSHQILVQTLGCLLVCGSSNMVPAERSMMPSTPRGSETDEQTDVGQTLLHDTHMPGMLRYLSSRSTLTLLQCLHDSYQMASDFDQRPGLKFLIQKVARADVAANMYKQAGVSLTFYIHALMEISAHQDNICVTQTKTLLQEMAVTKGGSNENTDNAIEDDDETKDSATDTKTTHEDTKTAKGPELLLKYSGALTSSGLLQPHMAVFVCAMKQILDEVCTSYVDMYLDQAGPSVVDNMSGQMLVFLLAQPEELPSVKRDGADDKSLKELVAEKLRKRSSSSVSSQEPAQQGLDASLVDQPVTFGVVPLQPTIEQEEPVPAQGGPDQSCPPSSDRQAPKSSQDRVYTVATDRTINKLMAQYKKRKQVHSMPTFVKATRSKPPVERKERVITAPTEREIENQQRASIMKDSEAQLAAWIEMICNVLQLFHQLPDHQYQALLPIIFNCVTQLICHCNNARLREVLAQWTYRIGHMYGFASEADDRPPSVP